MESPSDQQHGAIDYSAVLADLRAKRAAIDQLIQGVEQIIGIKAVAAVTPANGGPPGGAAQSVRDDSFFNMGIVDAVKKYLAMSKQPRSLTDIIAALESGGFVHDSANFYATVHSSLLRREKQVKDVVRVKRQWALSEWYRRTQQAADRIIDDDGTALAKPTERGVNDSVADAAPVCG